MIDAQTLVGLACLIANKGPTTNTSQIESTLTDTEKAQVQTIADSGVCLPGNVETLIQNTRIKIENGEIDDPMAGGSPTHDCMVGGGG